MLFNIAVCDDNHDEMQTTLGLLEKFRHMRPGVRLCTCGFDSAERLLESVNAGKTYNLFLLDVILPGVSGIELARILREKEPDVPLVFLAASADYALPAYKVSAMQYILKPVSEPEFFEVLDKIFASASPKNDDFFMLPIPEGTRKIPVSQIVYLEITDHIMRVRLVDGELLSSKSIKVPFQTAAASLFGDDRFLHAHKSYLINMEHVQQMRGRNFHMEGEHIIPVPKNKIAMAKGKYYKYLSRFGFERL